jgi:hypothetical protein
MLNKLLFGLLAVLFLVLPGGCKGRKQATFSKENHRSVFFPSLNAQIIVDYEFLYFADRGSYATLAKVTMSTNAYYSLLQKEFPEITHVYQPMDKEVYFEILRSRAASLVGGTNNVPIWFNPKRESDYNYMQRIDSSTERRIWWDNRENTIYFIATGKGDVRGAVPKQVTH